MCNGFSKSNENYWIYDQSFSKDKWQNNFFVNQILIACRFPKRSTWRSFFHHRLKKCCFIKGYSNTSSKGELCSCATVVARCFSFAPRVVPHDAASWPTHLHHSSVTRVMASIKSSLKQPLFPLMWTVGCCCFAPHVESKNVNYFTHCCRLHTSQPEVIGPRLVSGAPDSYNTLSKP